MICDSDCAAGELRALLMGLSLGGLPKTAGENADIDSEVGMLMTEFDSNQDGSVSREEFKSSLERCAHAAQTTAFILAPELTSCHDVAPRSCLQTGREAAWSWVQNMLDLKRLRFRCTAGGQSSCTKARMRFWCAG